MEANAPAEKPKKPKLNLFGPKFRAWWNGEETPSLELVEKTDEPAAGENQKPSILHASEALWGQGRTTPSDDEFDVLMANALAVQKTQKLFLFGSESGARPNAIIKALSCKIDSYEINADLKAAADKTIKASGQAKSFKSIAFDNKPGSLPKNKADAVLFTYPAISEAAMEVAGFAIARVLKPSGTAMFIDFILRHPEDDIEACKGDEGRGFLLEADINRVFSAAGLKVRSDEDWGAPFLNCYYRQQNKLLNNWENIQAQLMKAGGVAAMQSLLTQTIAWRARIDALKLGRLTLRKILLSKD